MGHFPNANGLQRAISGVAAFIEPSTLAISGVGLVSKFASDAGVKRQLNDLDRLLATGQTPTRFAPTRVAPALGGAQQPRQSNSMEPKAKDFTQIEGIVQDAIAQAVDFVESEITMIASRHNATLMVR